MAKKTNHVQEKDSGPKKAPFLVQALIFAGVLFAANIISTLIAPYFLLPTPVAGLILLYVLLTTGLIKLEWVEEFATSMIGIIGFLFVPSGISLAANLNIMKAEGVQLIAVIILSTIILLVVTAYCARGLEWVSKKIRSKKEPTKSKDDDKENHHPAYMN